MPIESDYFSVKKVLLVEDDDSSAKLVEAIFQGVAENRGRAEVLRVGSLAEAEAYLKKPQATKSIDVVLLDLTLPDSAGIETVTRFQSICPYIGVLVLTGDTDESIGIQAIENGAQNYLIKDETFPKLLIRQTNYAHHKFNHENLLNIAKKEAEIAAMLKDKYIRMVSHDLRNPLANIITSLKAVSSSNFNFSAQDKSQFIDVALNTSQELLDLVEKLLNSSRLQSGEMIPNSRFNNLFALVGEVITRLEYMLKRKNIQLHNAVDSGLRIYADPTLLKQLIQNLVENAIKFSAENSSITVCASKNAMVNVTVADSGVGIDQEKLARIEAEENQDSSIGTYGEVGSGWGFQYCRDIVKAHEGRLEIESALGQGTKVTAMFPNVIPEIILIGRDDMNIDSLKKSIDNLSGHLSVIPTGAEAVKYLATHPLPHLMFLSIELPDASGLEILEELKQNPRTSAIPIIMIIQENDLLNRTRALSLGANDFIDHQIQSEKLLPRVLQAIS